MLSIFGLVLVGIGVFLFLRHKKALDKVLEMKFTKTSTAGELQELQKAVADEIGPGGFNQLTEVKGTVECQAPLTAELSEQPCVWYTMSVVERYEEQYQERDAEGRVRTGTRTGTATVASNTQSVPFSIRDTSGMITITPNGAAIDGRKVVDRYEPAGGASNTLRIGTFQFSPSARSGRKVLGYQYSEQIIPLDARVYVIGEATDREGNLAVGKPADSEKPFILSMRSEEEVTRGMESSATAQKWIGILLVAGGLAMAIAGLM